MKKIIIEEFLINNINKNQLEQYSKAIKIFDEENFKKTI